MEDNIQHLKVMKSLVHQKDLMQMFAGSMEVKNMWEAITVVDKTYFSIIGTATIKGQTKFTRENFAGPHPRIHVETMIYYNWVESTLNMVLRVVDIVNPLPNVRFCLETYVSNTINTKVRWIERYYFGSEPDVEDIVDIPVILWKWYIDEDDHHVYHKGNAIGKLTELLTCGNLIIRMELLAMSTMEVSKRLMRAPLACGKSFVELCFNRYCGPLECLYRECGDFDICIYSFDSKAFFLCHKEILCSHSSVLKDKFLRPENEGVPYLKLEGASTDTVRILLYYMYHNQVDPRWIKVPVNVLETCLFFKVYGLMRKLVQIMSQRHSGTSDFSTLSWLFYENIKQLSLEMNKKMKNDGKDDATASIEGTSSAPANTDQCKDGMKILQPTVGRKRHT